MIHVACNLCGADNWKIRFPATSNGDAQLQVDAVRCTNSGYGNHAQIVQCRHCQHVYANPRWSPEQLLQAYEDVEDPIYLRELEGRELTFKRHLIALEQSIGPGHNRQLLDVGAYLGVFVGVALKSGWQACGIEPSRWAVQTAQSHNLPVSHGTLDSNDLKGKRFDVVTMWDVIEHLATPSEELRKAFHILKPGGTIVVHTMDIDSLTARIMGNRWPWLMDMHVHYFSQRTLRDMLSRSGFEVTWMGKEGRYLSAEYLASRVGGLSSSLGTGALSLFTKMKINRRFIYVNFGDLFTTYAKRP